MQTEMTRWRGQVHYMRDFASAPIAVGPAYELDLEGDDLAASVETMRHWQEAGRPCILPVLEIDLADPATTCFAKIELVGPSILRREVCERCSAQ
jgi:hypothetical protein